MNLLLAADHIAAGQDQPVVHRYERVLARGQEEGSNPGVVFDLPRQSRGQVIHPPRHAVAFFDKAGLDHDVARANGHNVHAFALTDFTRLTHVSAGF
ncbi:hypothetical protein D3C76_1671520 [compost metagenome]